MTVDNSTSALTMVLVALVVGVIVVGFGSHFILRAIHRISYSRKASKLNAITSEAAQLGQLLVRDDPALEANAKKLLGTPRATTLHATAHYVLGMVDDRRGDFASMKEHLRVAVAALAHAPVLPTEKDAREMRETSDATTLFFAFALAACGDLDEAKEQLEKVAPVSEQHVGLRLRASALILARRKEWDALGAELSVPFDELPMLGPSSKLLLRTLKERAASGQAYRAAAATTPENAEPDADEKRRMAWVAKAIGDEGDA